MYRYDSRKNQTNGHRAILIMSGLSRRAGKGAAAEESAPLLEDKDDYDKQPDRFADDKIGKYKSQKKLENER